MIKFELKTDSGQSAHVEVIDEYVLRVIVPLGEGEVWMLSPIAAFKLGDDEATMALAYDQLDRLNGYIATVSRNADSFRSLMEAFRKIESKQLESRGDEGTYVSDTAVRIKMARAWIEEWGRHIDSAADPDKTLVLELQPYLIIQILNVLDSDYVPQK